MDARIAVIPARGGSKRIPRKNLKDFLGEPMISWPIKALVKTNLFNAIFVSTDDPEIAELSSALGATALQRDPSLSDDFSHTTDVLKDAVSKAIPDSQDPWVYKIYPTTPATYKEIAEFVAFTESRDRGLTVSVSRSSVPIQRALVRNSLDFLEFREPEFAITRSQDLEPTFFDAGKFYGGRKSDWLGTETPLLSSARGFELPDWLAVDLDTLEDWELAEYKVRKRFGH